MAGRFGLSIRSLPVAVLFVLRYAIGMDARTDAELAAFLPRLPSFHLTRFLFLRLLGFIYLVAFVSLYAQLDPLLGHGGLLPAASFLGRVATFLGSRSAGFWRLPSLFWLGASDGAMHAACLAGVVLSAAVWLGVTNALVQIALWVLYMSFVHVGQIFYGYGWESQLLETGFLAIFLCPIRSLRPLPASPPPTVVIWLLRWLVFRVMIGAGLIKLRGDPCWRDLTCLAYHYETQPLPNPLSWLLHQMPGWFHKGGVLFNHGVELVVPWFAFGPRPVRHVAGALLVAFQVVLILSGNLSFLNWLTIAPIIACFDDDLLARLFPERVRARVADLAGRTEPSRVVRGVSYALATVVAVLSLNPIANMMSRRQAMNTSFEPFRLVNTYGAFGAVGRERYEVILEGTRDEVPGDRTRWLEYELPCKPGDVRRRPCVVSPYHYRLDWQIWFAAFSTYDEQPWLVHLAYKLLRGDPRVRRLLARDPFMDGPPRWIRAELYRYRFTRIGDGSGAWWVRERRGEYMRPVSLDDPDLYDFLDQHGWAHP